MMIIVMDKWLLVPLLLLAPTCTSRRAIQRTIDPIVTLNLICIVVVVVVTALGCMHAEMIGRHYQKNRLGGAKHRVCLARSRKRFSVVVDFWERI